MTAPAALPAWALSSDILQVSVAGSYGGVSFAINDLAVVRLDGTSVTRIPSAGMSAVEVASAIATALSALKAQDIHNDPLETGAPGTNVGLSLGNLQGQLDDANNSIVELQGRANNETTARQSADAALQTAVNNEAAARATADNALSAAIALKLDASAYVQHFLGKYASLSALQVAHPTGVDGDYAIIDAGAGTAARQYVWDNEAGWIDSGDIKSGTTSDQLSEGSTNLFFTAARVRAVVLTGIDLVTSAAITATDTVLGALGKLQAQITALTGTVSNNTSNIATNASAISTVTNQQLLGWAYDQSFRLVSVTRDTNGAIATASIVWPDGATGTFTTDTASTAFPGAIDAWHATHVLAGITKTATQTAVTRDANGKVTSQPAITIV